MAEVFISYARSTEPQANQVAEALRASGYVVWIDNDLPAHRRYTKVLEERLRAAKAVVVVWSSAALQSDWVRSEADVARKARTLVQLSIDGALPPLPFDQIHCVNLEGWTGDPDGAGWRKVSASVAELTGRETSAPVTSAPAARAAPALPDKPSIAVLPFANLSNDPDHDYFVQGMMDEIVTALTRIRSLFVIGSGSSLTLKGQSLDAPEAARRLGVRYILDGSVRRSGSRVRISVKLTDAAANTQIWAERFDGELDDIFALQDDVALSVAGVIEPTVIAVEARRAARRPLENLGCYDLYLRAAALRATLHKAEVFAAVELLDRALDLEPDFAPALAQAAGCHSQIYVNEWSQAGETHRRRGLELAERAIAAGTDDASVLAQTANALMELDNDLNRAGALIERATKLNPGSAYAWFISGLIRMLNGQPASAIEQFQRAARLDPLSTLGEVARVHEAVCRGLELDFENALRLFRETTFRTPRVRLALVALYGHMDMVEEGRRELALYYDTSDIPAEALVTSMSGTVEQRTLLLAGLARVTEAPEV